MQKFKKDDVVMDVDNMMRATWLAVVVEVKKQSRNPNAVDVESVGGVYETLGKWVPHLDENGDVLLDMWQDYEHWREEPTLRQLWGKDLVHGGGHPEWMNAGDGWDDFLTYH